MGVMGFPPLSAVVRKGDARARASPCPFAVPCSPPVYAPPRLLGTRFASTREEEVGVERAGRMTPPPLLLLLLHPQSWKATARRRVPSLSRMIESPRVLVRLARHEQFYRVCLNRWVREDRGVREDRWVSEGR